MFIVAYDSSDAIVLTLYRWLDIDYRFFVMGNDAEVSVLYVEVNWKYIFQCECCKLENDDAIPSTLPDLSIIYKLHLESRKLINMYDWLQVTICFVFVFTD